MTLPKCSEPGCTLTVWVDAPTRTINGLTYFIGGFTPQSDKCYYHAHGQPLPDDVLKRCRNKSEQQPS